MWQVHVCELLCKCHLFRFMQQGCWNTLKSFSSAILRTIHKKIVTAEIGNGDYFSAVIASDTLPFQLQWQPLTSVWLKWHSFLLALEDLKSKVALPATCHHSVLLLLLLEARQITRCQWGDETSILQGSNHKKTCSVLFLRWNVGFEGRQANNWSQFGCCLIEIIWCKL